MALFVVFRLSLGRWGTLGRGEKLHGFLLVARVQIPTECADMTRIAFSDRAWMDFIELPPED